MSTGVYYTSGQISEMDAAMKAAATALAAGNYTGPNGVISALNTYYSTQVYVPGTQTVMRGYAQLALDVLNNTGVGSVANQEVADAIGRASYTTAFQAKLAYLSARQDFADQPVLMFRNSASGELNVVYRRSDGHIGWIDPNGGG